jgi:hypothetical protein
MEIRAADVEAAFMQGDRQHGDQELYMEQPLEGLPGVKPTVLIRILKGVLGLATAPRHWWAKLKRLVLAVQLVDAAGAERHYQQHPLDPAFYFATASDGSLLSVLVVHVDDLLIAVARNAPRALRAMETLLPWGDWRDLPFSFCGKDAWRDEHGILCLSQQAYAENIEDLTLPRQGKQSADAEATAKETADNRSALGALGWLCTQTRPDLSARVALAQRAQTAPRVSDLIETARLVKLARQHSDTCLRIARLEGDLALVTYHDASWANAEEDGQPTKVAKLVAAVLGKGSKKPKIRSQAGYIMPRASRAPSPARPGPCA